MVAAVSAALERGTTFGAPCAAEVELAERVVRAYPAVEQVRFVSSGTEAVMSAIRVARAFTGRDLIVKFAGCYHGHADHLLVAAGSGLATFGRPSSAGVPEAFTACTRVLPLDDEAAAQALFAREGARIAAVIIEPVPANHGLLLQRREFLQRLRELTQRARRAADLRRGDLGFPPGARRRSRAHRDRARPGHLRQGHRRRHAGGRLRRRAPHHGAARPGRGHLPGRHAVGQPGGDGRRACHPRSARARDGLAAARESLGAELEALVRPVLARAPFPVHWVRAGSLFWMSLHDAGAPRNAATLTERGDARASRALFHAMLARGVYLPPSAYEACFLSLAHTSADLQQLRGRRSRDSLAALA